MTPEAMLSLSDRLLSKRRIDGNGCWMFTGSIDAIKSGKPFRCVGESLWTSQMGGEFTFTVSEILADYELKPDPKPRLFVYIDQNGYLRFAGGPDHIKAGRDWERILLLDAPEVMP